VTTTTVTAHAPGKLFLTGEYAVLAGGPALVAAVDRRAHVRLELQSGRGAWVIESLAEGSVWEGRVADDGPAPGGDAAAVLSALRACAVDDARGHVRVDSRAFLVGERKLGLGRSAATLAAAVAAILGARGIGERASVLERALAANALLQDGHGSGADVAAAVHGGLVEVRRTGGGVAVVPRSLPAGLRLVAAWTGASAPTSDVLVRFEAARERGLPALSVLTALAEAAAAAVARGDAAGLDDAVRRSADCLAVLGAEAGIPIVTPELARLVAAAGAVGVAAKPSGAGAGDCGIGLARSAAEAAAVSVAWRSAGMLPLALDVTSRGVTVG
jgi:phosphomevalonate kinase